MTKKKKGHQSGFYTSETGTPFHVHGHNMSDETLKAIGKSAKMDFGSCLGNRR